MKLRNIWIAFVLLSFGILAGEPASAQRVSLDALAQQVQSLVSRVTTLEAENARLTQLLVHFSRNDNDIFVTAANLHVVNGQNSTRTTNGLGNIIIGYNEPRPIGNARTGSHMLVVGRELNYTSFGGIVVGTRNNTSGEFSSVSGGDFNTAGGRFSSVSGGTQNTASGESSSVSGGQANTASGTFSSVSGGRQNTASGERWSSVSGGEANTASGSVSSVSGGFTNTANGAGSSISGGQFNFAAGLTSAVAGGNSNSAIGEDASVSGGMANRARGLASVVGGGAGREVANQFDWRAGSGLFQED